MLFDWRQVSLHNHIFAVDFGCSINKTNNNTELLNKSYQCAEWKKHYDFVHTSGREEIGFSPGLSFHLPKSSNFLYILKRKPFRFFVLMKFKFPYSLFSFPVSLPLYPRTLLTLHRSCQRSWRERDRRIVRNYVMHSESHR